MEALALKDLVLQPAVIAQTDSVAILAIWIYLFVIWSHVSMEALALKEQEPIPAATVLKDLMVIFVKLTLISVLICPILALTEALVLKSSVLQPAVIAQTDLMEQTVRMTFLSVYRKPVKTEALVMKASELKLTVLVQKDLKE
jgi:hypothetical protein